MGHTASDRILAGQITAGQNIAGLCKAMIGFGAPWNVQQHPCLAMAIVLCQRFFFSINQIFAFFLVQFRHDPSVENGADTAPCISKSEGVQILWR
jgi:hypothetical protein